MTRFFGLFSVCCSLALLVAMALGMWPAAFGATLTTHVLWSLTAALLTVSLHCLVFAIFTGSGKDTRLLVQDLALDRDYVARTKRFKREVFPPALYAIGLVVLTTTAGGLLALGSAGSWARYAHLFLAWVTFFYNARVSLLEYRAVAENAAILATVNRDAERVFVAPEGELPEPAEGTLQWETHVYALGKFLCFLGYNVWLPYIYLRYIVGWLNTPFWLFLAGSVLCLAGGYYLRWRYGAFRPDRSTKVTVQGA